MKALLFIILFSLGLSAFSQEGKKVQFVGGARSLISQSDFTSDVSDTVTAPKTTGGYALIDLGFKINPNENTEVLGMIRINNQFGGFYGAGVTFDVRQIHVKGVAGKVLRYQIGNIDYKLTPYTFYNHNPDLLVQSLGINKIKEEVLNYESFYKNNNWRQQGAAADFAIQFPKLIQELKFNGFITRLNPSASNVLERLYGGGNVIMKQSKYLTIGVNHVRVFDLLQTADNDNAYRNVVNSISYDLNKDGEKIKLSLDGESGMSKSFSTQNAEGGLSDFFIHVKGQVSFKKCGLKLKMAYMENGADFRSFGAQSKRMDFNQVNSFYDRYTNSQILRPLSYYDLYNDPSLYSSSISTKIMSFNPSINNVLPYGIATFNRQGFYAGFNYSDPKKIIAADVTFYRLGEIRGQGTTQLRSFSYLTSTVSFNLSNWMHWKKKQVFQLGLAYQETARSSQFTFEQINLKSLTASLGLELEICPDLYLLGSAFLFSSKGNESMPVRTPEGTIINFNEYLVDGREINLSSGIKFNFSKEVYVAAVYESNKNNFSAENPYKYNQILLYYIMKF